MRWDCGKARSACCKAELIVQVKWPQGFIYFCSRCGDALPEVTGEVTHAAADEVTGDLPCCGLKMFQCPITDRSTTIPGDVDCPGPPEQPPGKQPPGKPGKVRQAERAAHRP